MLHQPIEKWCIVFGGGAAQAVQAPGDAQLVPQREIMQTEKTPGQVQRSRQQTGTEATPAPIRRHKPQSWLTLKQMRDADRTAKMGKVSTATHADVLAGIDRLSAGDIGEGAGSSAQPLPRFEQRHSEAARR